MFMYQNTSPVMSYFYYFFYYYYFNSNNNNYYYSWKVCKFIRIRAAIKWSTDRFADLPADKTDRLPD
ncbi:hypothetical protein DPMN_027460 [Dreissena polymorpha]|uniref:Uncharacterized protein n=1 Tax=Dreissena polymorpha TaxID=45954 RepID=A0A9D4LSX0_DREPO|nr:hypothetical protein DPMN_027460 [Dreissena polymorpha]